MSNLNKIDPQISKFTLTNLSDTLLFGNPFFSDEINLRILDATVEYILSRKKFD